jgi:hypothetical protein
MSRGSEALAVLHHSPQALSIFEHYGFKPYTGKATID